MIAALLIAALSFEQGLALKKQEKFAEAEAVFAALVREHPQDAAALEQWATLLGWLGRFDESIAAWRQAAAVDPAKPDYAVGLARVQYWKGDLEAARKGLDAVATAAPRSLDALALLGDVCTAQRDSLCARDRYERAAALDPADPVLQRKLAATAGPATRRLDAGGIYDSYDTNRGREGSFFLQGSALVAAPLVLSAGYEQLRQFGLVDHRLNLTAYLNPAESLQLGARLAVSPGAQTIAGWDATLSAEQRVWTAASALLSVRHLHFTGNGVTIVGPGVRLSKGPLALVVSGGPVFSTAFATQAFAQGRLEWVASDSYSFYAGLSRGGEAQVVPGGAATPGAPASEIRTTTDLVAGALWQATRAIGLRLDFTREVREGSYTRLSAGSAVNYRF